MRPSLSLLTSFVASRANRPLDLVLFGASGFSGRLIVEELARVCHRGSYSSHVRRDAGDLGERDGDSSSETPCKWPLRWGVAGRNESKLRSAIVDAENRLGKQTWNSTRGKSGQDLFAGELIFCP